MSRYVFQYLPSQIQIIKQLRADTKYLIITKGRRFGITQFVAHWFVEMMLEGEQLLWGDTIHSNIDRYVDRFFTPLLKKNGIGHNFNRQKKTLTIDRAEGYVDFRSADKPENWEGFGYHKIFLNEAGIILKNDYLYTNAVLPMLLDFPDSLLIAGGVPKGKTRKDGSPHKYYTLAQNAMAGEKGYQYFNFSSYDNPLLRAEDIDDMKDAMRDDKTVKQEIYGQFVDGAGGVLWDDVIIHKAKVKTHPKLQRTIVAIDPATTSKATSDETGIVVLGKTSDGNIYVLEDLSGRYTPEGWARVASGALKKWDGDCYVAEKNQGGDMVQSVIRQMDTHNRVKLVTATKGKYVRAEPIYSLYEQGKIFHVGHMPLLEAQMTQFNPNSNEKSPDRVDALVWGATELSQGIHQKADGNAGRRSRHKTNRL